MQAKEVVILRKKANALGEAVLGEGLKNFVHSRALSFRHKPKSFLELAVLKKPVPSRKGENTIRQLFLDVSMVNHIDGLQVIAKKRGFDPADLKPGDFLLFMNAQGNYCKLMGANMRAGQKGFVGKDLPGIYPVMSVKAPRGRIHEALLAELPKFFNGKPFDYDAVLRPVLEAHLASRRRERVGILRERIAKEMAADKTQGEE